jgi:hypothetical protein
MLNQTQNTLLLQAVDLLQEADNLIQKALGASDECYEMHNAIENCAEEVLDYIQQNNKVDA